MSCLLGINDDERQKRIAGKKESIKTKIEKRKKRGLKEKQQY